MNSTVNPGKPEFRKYSKVFQVKEEKPIKTRLFEFKVNNQIDEILKSEKAILDQFESKLWKGGKPSLAYISAGSDLATTISIASSQKHSDALEETCFLGGLKVSGLEVIRKQKPKCGIVNVVPAQNKPVEEFVVSAFAAVGTRSLTSGRFFPALIAGAAGVAGVTFGVANMVGAYQENQYDDDSYGDDHPWDG